MSKAGETRPHTAAWRSSLRALGCLPWRLPVRRHNQRPPSSSKPSKLGPEHVLAAAHPHEPFVVAGCCYVCRRRVAFQVDHQYSAAHSKEPNWRERVVCPGCGLNNRLRASVHLFEQLCEPRADARIYLTEQVTPLYAALRERFTSVTGSEYLGSGWSPGRVDDRGVRHESMTGLSFDDNQFDYLLSFDVFEHIPTPRQAFTECARVLAPGGALLFSVPFLAHADANLIRARLGEDGAVEHLLEPEYHGDPVNEAGCLCFQHFGWQVLEQLRAAGFQRAEAIEYHAPRFGYLGGRQHVFLAWHAGA